MTSPAPLYLTETDIFNQLPDPNSLTLIWKATCKLLTKMVRAHKRCVEIPHLGKFRNDQFMPALELVTAGKFTTASTNSDSITLPMTPQAVIFSQASLLSLTALSQTLEMEREVIAQAISVICHKFVEVASERPVSLNCQIGLLNVANGQMTFEPTT